MLRRNSLLISLVFATQAFADSAYQDWPVIAGPYLGQQPPGMMAEMFAPGIISTDKSEINSVFTPDGMEFYFTTWEQETGTSIMVTRQVDGREDSFGGADLYISFRTSNGAWSALQNMGAAVNSEQRDFCPMLSPDGKYLFFSSKRAGEGDIFWVDAKVIEEFAGSE